MKKVALFLAAISTVAASAPAGAWNARGHMIVAAVAWKNMTPGARTRAGELLKLNPLYDDWTAGISDPEARARTAFLMAATWPDIIKSADGYTDDEYDASSPRVRQNIGYSDHNQHRYWHFKDIPFSPDRTPRKQAPVVNAETQIIAFTAALSSSTTSEDVKSYDLAWLVHIVGDVHQPLHATSRFTAALRNGDGGGNKVLICLPEAPACPRDRFKNLHSFWDGAFGNSSSVRTAGEFGEALASAPAASANIADPKVWIRRSFEQAKSHAYVGPIGTSNAVFRITAAYRTDVSRVAHSQAAIGGARLANLLNAALGPHP